MVDDLHSRGIKVLLWQIPLLETGQSEDGHEQVLAEGEAMVREGHAVREADGAAYLNRGWWFPKSLMPVDQEVRAVAGTGWVCGAGWATAATSGPAGHGAMPTYFVS